jgi:DNA-binding NarL/FixJ family response regulator
VSITVAKRNGTSAGLCSAERQWRRIRPTLFSKGATARCLLSGELDGFASAKFLIVDDHPIIAAGLECLIRELGHEAVASITTAEEAISNAARYKPDLILMDVYLEGEMDGIEAAVKIRQHLRIRSIFFSGYADPAIRHRAARADPAAFLDKTSSQAALAGVINAVAAEHAALAEMR